MLYRVITYIYTALETRSCSGRDAKNQIDYIKLRDSGMPFYIAKHTQVSPAGATTFPICGQCCPTLRIKQPDQLSILFDDTGEGLSRTNHTFGRTEYRKQVRILYHNVIKHHSSIFNLKLSLVAVKAKNLSGPCYSTHS